MKQPTLRIGRLLEATGRRRAQAHLDGVAMMEHGVLRALARAFGENPPPLPSVDEREEPDPREEMVMKLVRANQ